MPATRDLAGTERPPHGERWRKKMRTFVAIDPPRAVKEGLALVQERLRAVEADVAWTRPENLHLTLKFLGEVERARLEAILAGCQRAVRGREAFDLLPSGLGFFPNPRHPRVIQTGVSGGTVALEEVERATTAELTRAGFDRETRSFHPHLTLGRLRSDRNAAELVARAREIRLPEESFRVTRIVIFKSELLPAGARYTRLATIEF
jgi:2'-5' RNA ligase